MQELNFEKQTKVLGLPHESMMGQENEYIDTIKRSMINCELEKVTNVNRSRSSTGANTKTSKASLSNSEGMLFSIQNMSSSKTNPRKRQTSTKEKKASFLEAVTAKFQKEFMVVGEPIPYSSADSQASSFKVKKKLNSPIKDPQALLDDQNRRMAKRTRRQKKAKESSHELISSPVERKRARQSIKAFQELEKQNAAGEKKPRLGRKRANRVKIQKENVQPDVMEKDTSA